MTIVLLHSLVSPVKFGSIQEMVVRCHQHNLQNGEDQQVKTALLRILAAIEYNLKGSAKVRMAISDQDVWETNSILAKHLLPTAKSYLHRIDAVFNTPEDALQFISENGGQLVSSTAE